MQAIVDELAAQRKASEAHYKKVEEYMVLIGSAFGARMTEREREEERASEAGEEDGNEGDDEEGKDGEE
jgi:hypothetical protein